MKAIVYETYGLVDAFWTKKNLKIGRYPGWHRPFLEVPPGRNPSKTGENRTFFPHYQNSPPGGLAYVIFFSDQ